MVLNLHVLIIQTIKIPIQSIYLILLIIILLVKNDFNSIFTILIVLISPFLDIHNIQSLSFLMIHPHFLIFMMKNQAFTIYLHVVRIFIFQLIIHLSHIQMHLMISFTFSLVLFNLIFLLINQFYQIFYHLMILLFQNLFLFMIIY